MRRNLSLYLALACFVGLIAIFVVDGYLGIYDVAAFDKGQFAGFYWLGLFLKLSPQPL